MIIQRGWYTLGGHGPFKTLDDMYKFLREPTPLNTYYKCPQCNKEFKDYEVKRDSRISKSPLCPECVLVSLKYIGKK